jgi:hypothetical protein
MCPAAVELSEGESFDSPNLKLLPAQNYVHRSNGISIRLTSRQTYPFLPNTLAYTIDFLRRHAELHQKEGWELGKDCHVERLLACLRKFREIYPSVKELLDNLEPVVKFSIY